MTIGLALHFIVAMAAGSVIGLGLFIWRELSIDYPVVDLRALRHRALAGGSAYSLVLGMGIYGVIFAGELRFCAGLPAFLRDAERPFANAHGDCPSPALTMVAMGKSPGASMPARSSASGRSPRWQPRLVMSINPDTGASSLFWPLMLRAIGSVCMFLLLSLATLGSLPRDKVSAGAGFYNLTRQLGSSIGIAIITTLLAHREAVHRAGLVEKSPLINRRHSRGCNFTAGCLPATAPTRWSRSFKPTAWLTMP